MARFGHESVHVIETGRVDFGLVPNGRDLRRSECTPIFEEILYLVSKREGTEANNGPLPMRHLERIKLVATGRQIHLRRHIQDAATKIGLILNVAYEQQSVTTILNWPAVTEYWEAGIVDARPIVRPDLRRTMSLALPQSRSLTIAAEAVYQLFQNLLIEEVQSERWKGKLLVSTPPNNTV